MKDKILKSLKDLNNIRKQYPKQSIGLCHGVFDVIHSGHIKYFKYSKKASDLLVVSITGDKYVNKGIDRPYNKSSERAEVISSIKFVDYVFINQDFAANNVIKNLKPNNYFKGYDYKKVDFAGNLKSEVKTLKKFKGKYALVNKPLKSSSKIINNVLQNRSKDEINYLKKMSNIINPEFINLLKKKFENLTINLIGEPILDKYIFVEKSNLTTKDSALSTVKNKNETHLGGIFLPAQILANFVKKINLITYGDKKILNKIENKFSNIKIINVANLKIQTKTRIINSYTNEKFIQVTNFKKNKFNENQTKKILNEITKIKKNLIIIDYGIGLFDKKVLNLINKLKVQKFVNVQTNSINQGFNLFTKYTNYKYLCLNKREWSLGMNDSDINEKKILKFSKKFLSSNFAMTKGKYGSSLIKDKKIISSPSFFNFPIDTTGCGDIYFIISSILLKAKINPYLIPFISNVLAGMHGNILGNKKITSLKEFQTELSKLIKI